MIPYTITNHTTCLLQHDMYDAKGGIALNSVVEDRKLPEAYDWAWEICCENHQEGRNGITKECKEPAMTLDQRVKELLRRGLKGVCDDHLVCEILSPVDLQEIGSNNIETCITAVKRWWKVFHRLFVAIRDFGEIFQHKFDINKYSIMYNISTNDTSIKKENNPCQVRHSMDPLMTLN